VCDLVAGIEESEEAATADGVTKPPEPTEAEIADHERTHLLFRSWCKHCVAGRGRSDPHRSRDKTEKGIPTISWDYMYMMEKPTKTQGRPAVVEGEGLPIVVSVGSTSGAVFSYVVQQKGENNYAITRGCQDVQHLLGYKKMIFKGDQEPAL